MKITDRDFLIAGVITENMLRSEVMHNRKMRRICDIAVDAGVDTKRLATGVLIHGQKPTEVIKNIKGRAKRGKVATS